MFALEKTLCPRCALEVGTLQRVAHYEFRIADLLEKAGRDSSTIQGKQFEHCTIHGPAIITSSPPPAKETAAPTGDQIFLLFLQHRRSLNA